MTGIFTFSDPTTLSSVPFISTPSPLLDAEEKGNTYIHLKKEDSHAKQHSGAAMAVDQMLCITLRTMARMTGTGIYQA